MLFTSKDPATLKDYLMNTLGIKKYTIIKNNDGTVTIFKKCSVTHKIYLVTVDYPDYNNWQTNMLIQDAMPNLSDDEREFLITHMTPAEYNKMFGFNDNDSDEE